MSPRSLILDHFWLKLFSVVLATLIWLAVHSNLSNDSSEPRRFLAAEPTATRSFPHRPIMVLTDAGERPAVLVEPNEASVTISGPETLMNELRDQDIRVFVRLPDRREPRGEFPVHAHLPPGTRMVLVIPETVTVKTL